MSNFNVEIQDLAIFKKIKNKEVKGGCSKFKKSSCTSIKEKSV